MHPSLSLATQSRMPFGPYLVCGGGHRASIRNPGFRQGNGISDTPARWNETLSKCRPCAGAPRRVPVRSRIDTVQSRPTRSAMSTAQRPDPQPRSNPSASGGKIVKRKGRKIGVERPLVLLAEAAARLIERSPLLAKSGDRPRIHVVGQLHRTPSIRPQNNRDFQPSPDRLRPVTNAIFDDMIPSWPPRSMPRHQQYRRGTSRSELPYGPDHAISHRVRRTCSRKFQTRPKSRTLPLRALRDHDVRPHPVLRVLDQDGLIQVRAPGIGSTAP